MAAGHGGRLRGGIEGHAESSARAVLGSDGEALEGMCRDGAGILDHLFFQAEDGIRDYKVTGVQTCALPILALGVRPCSMSTMSTTSAMRRSTGRGVRPRICISITSVKVFLPIRSSTKSASR